MEQKKILWILLSVTLFLFIVSITGVVWFYPGRVADARGSKSAGTPEKAAADLDPVEWVRQGHGYPGMVKAPAANSNSEDGFSIVYGETDNGGAASNSAADKNTAADNKITELVTEKVAPKVNTPVVINKAPSRIVSKTVVKATAPAPHKINVLEYWIQAGSYTSKSRAESASRILKEKGFSTLITIKTVNSNDYFRVRMGPYTSKAEANKFLGWIKEIDSYKKSYISQVYVQKTVN